MKLLEPMIYNNPLALDGINFRLLSVTKVNKQMTSYLLLRDNKESGPYTVEDLLNFGLKPYDLVWVKGKSAAWRYPSEVDELKPYAPVVEEQPFDRFYKKDFQQQKKEELPVINEYKQPAPVLKEKPPAATDYSRYIPAAKKEETAFVPKKSVFVTLPGQQQPTTKKNIQPAYDVEPSPVTSPIVSVVENPAAAEIKYSQPLDEIKEMYVKTLQQRKDKKVKRVHFINLLKKVAVFAGLIVSGVLAGFLIKSNSGKEDTVVHQMLQTSPLINNNRPVNDDASLTGNAGNKESPVNEAVPEDEKYEQRVSKTPEESLPAEEPTTIRIRKETMLPVPNEKENFTPNQEFAQQPAETDPLTGERNRKVRMSFGGNGIEEKAIMRSNKSGLYNLVSVASNDYKRVAFGGIRNLYLTVTNNSKYELDNVIVELQYLKPSEEPLRTENIKFVSVAPNASATMRVPDTNRGIKISYKIINIDSKQNSDAVAGK